MRPGAYPVRRRRRGVIADPISKAQKRSEVEQRDEKRRPRQWADQDPEYDIGRCIRNALQIIEEDHGD